MSMTIQFSSLVTKAPLRVRARLQVIAGMTKETPLADSHQEKNKLECFKNDRKSSSIVAQILQTEFGQSFSNIPCLSTHFAVLVPQTVWIHSLPWKKIEFSTFIRKRLFRTILRI